MRKLIVLVGKGVITVKAIVGSSTLFLSVVLALMVCTGGVGYGADLNIDWTKQYARMGLMTLGHHTASASNPCTGKLVCQGFEGTGYDNSESWSESGTIMDEDYTTVALHGSQSLRAYASANQGYILHTFSASQTEVWGYFLFRPVTLPATSISVLSVLDSGSNESYSAELETSGKWTCRINGSAPALGTVAAMSTGTTYHVWFHFKNGNGTAVCSVGFSTDGTEPTSGNYFVTKTNGTETDNLASVRIGWVGNTTLEWILDKLRISTSGTLGNNPD